MLALQWDKDSAIKASFDDGVETGISQGIESVAINMLRDGEPIEKICKFTKLPLERIKEIAISINK